MLLSEDIINRYREHSHDLQVAERCACVCGTHWLRLQRQGRKLALECGEWQQQRDDGVAGVCVAYKVNELLLMCY